MTNELETMLRSILKDELKPLHDGQKKLGEGQQKLEEGQVRLEGRISNLEDGQVRLEGRISNLEKGQVRLEGRISNLEEGQVRLEGRISNLEDGQVRLEARQENLEHSHNATTQAIVHLQDDVKELTSLMKHHTVLMTENFTNIRKDMRIVTNDTCSDIDLLFSEVQTVKRKTNKLEKTVFK